MWLESPSAAADDETLDRLADRVVWSHGETRRPLPGLALAAAVARAHGGELLCAPGAGGLAIGLALSLRSDPPA